MTDNLWEDAFKRFAERLASSAAHCDGLTGMIRRTIAEQAERAIRELDPGYDLPGDGSCACCEGRGTHDCPCDRVDGPCVACDDAGWLPCDACYSSGRASNQVADQCDHALV